MLSNIIDYDYWLHWQLTSLCNLNCEYCISWLNGKKFKPKPVDIDNVLTNINKTGKRFKINFTGGGEPFMVPNIKELSIELTKKHYIAFNSNLTSPKIEDFINSVNPQKILHFHASTHLEELFKKKLVGRFVENYHIIKNKNIKIKASVVAFPPLLKKMDNIIEFFENEKIKLEFDLFIGKYAGKLYPDAYTKEELNYIKVTENWSKKYSQYKQKCNAGYNIGVVTPNGNIYSCCDVYSRLGNIYKEIKFKNFIIKCPSKRCTCPFNLLDKDLYRKALKEDKLLVREISPIANSYRRLFALLNYYRVRNI